LTGGLNGVGGKNRAYMTGDDVGMDAQPARGLGLTGDAFLRGLVEALGFD